MKIEKKILDFINNNRISVLTTVLSNGKPHSSSMHFAGSIDSGFIFFTEKNSRKCSHFENDETYPAAMVIGFDENEFIELQLEGEVEMASAGKNLENGWKTYTAKFPGSDKWRNSKTDVLLKFIPKWWRYTEFKPEKNIISSE